MHFANDPLCCGALPRRRRLLATGGCALLAALAGCASGPPRGTVPMPVVPLVPGPLPPLAPRDLVLLNRASWGAHAASARALATQGRRDWLQAQLHPADPGDARRGLPAEALAQIDAMALSTMPVAELARQLEQQRRDIDAQPGDDARQAARQAYQQAQTRLARDAASRLLLRALHSPQQLQEQVSWFWCNHFSVHQHKANLRVLVGDYEQQALRPRALGRFRDLLVAATTHAAMLRYLDNEQNAADRLNENHARELMELHTLGVDGGYRQADVQALARVLTGVGVRLAPPEAPPRLRPELQALYVREGLTEFNPARHDFGAKTLLGQATQGRGWDEVMATLDRLAQHPATARHVSLRLAQYFVADAPAPALVADMVASFERSGGDIALTLQTMFDAPAFADAPPAKFKDPMRYVLSALRLAYDDRPVRHTGPVLGWLTRLGEAPFNHQTPDGYPLAMADWSGSGQLAARFDVARQIGGGSSGLFKPDTPDAPDAPAFAQLANALYHQAIEPTLGPRTRAALAQAGSAQEWNALLLSSPEFMLR